MSMTLNIFQIEIDIALSSSGSDGETINKDTKKKRKGRSPKRSKHSSVKTRSDLSPDSRRMVTSANGLQRARICTVDAFPNDRGDFTWTTLKLLPNYTEKLNSIDKDTKDDILNYVSSHCHVWSVVNINPSSARSGKEQLLRFVTT
jgi:hypothetical protein